MATINGRNTVNGSIWSKLLSHTASTENAAIINGLTIPRLRNEFLLCFAMLLPCVRRCRIVPDRATG